MIRRSTPPRSRTFGLAGKAAVATVTAGLTIFGGVQPAAFAATPSDPVGYLDQVIATGSTAISVQGWAADPDNLTLPLTVRATLDGAVAAQVVTAVSRPDVVKAQMTGPKPGFAMTLAAQPGSHTVCVTAVNISAGGDTSLGCRTVVVPVPIGSTPTAAQIAASSPFGTLEKVSASGNTVTLTGWAADPDNLAQPQRSTPDTTAAQRWSPRPRWWPGPTSRCLATSVATRASRSPSRCATATTWSARRRSTSASGSTGSSAAA